MKKHYSWESSKNNDQTRKACFIVKNWRNQGCIDSEREKIQTFFWCLWLTVLFYFFGCSMSQFSKPLQNSSRTGGAEQDSCPEQFHPPLIFNEKVSSSRSLLSHSPARVWTSFVCSCLFRSYTYFSCCSLLVCDMFIFLYKALGSQSMVL